MRGPITVWADLRPSPGPPGIIPGWLDGPRFDLGLLFGVALLALGMSGVTVYRPELFFPVLTVHIWLFSYEHLIATYTRLLVRPEDRARHRWLIACAPLVLLALFCIGRRFGLIGLYTAYFLGQLHHTVRQSWGLAQRYRQRAGGLPFDPVWLSELTLWSVPLWGLLHRCAQRPDEFLFHGFTEDRSADREQIRDAGVGPLLVLVAVHERLNVSL